MKNLDINWSEVYSNSTMAKEIGQEVISRVNNDNGYVYTHNAVYHADDVFSTALLRYVNKDLKVIRTRNMDNDYFTYDVGGGAFDHHQCDEFRTGEDGIFASFGKLWCTVGRTIEGLREEAWKEIDNSFVQLIDLTDNTGVMNPVNYFINSMKSNGIDDNSFNAAVDAAYMMLSQIIQSGLKKSKELDEFEAEVAKASKDSDVLELSRHYTIDRDTCSKLSYDWILYPDGMGNYTIQSIGGKLMPEDKRGLGNGNGVIFTHKGGWIGKAIDKATALSLIS